MVERAIHGEQRLSALQGLGKGSLSHTAFPCFYIKIVFTTRTRNFPITKEQFTVAIKSRPHPWQKGRMKIPWHQAQMYKKFF